MGCGQSKSGGAAGRGGRRGAGAGERERKRSGGRWAKKCPSRSRGSDAIVLAPSRCGLHTPLRRLPHTISRRRSCNTRSLRLAAGGEHRHTSALAALQRERLGSLARSFLPVFGVNLQQKRNPAHLGSRGSRGPKFGVQCVNVRPMYSAASTTATPTRHNSESDNLIDALIQIPSFPSYCPDPARDSIPQRL